MTTSYNTSDQYSVVSHLEKKYMYTFLPKNSDFLHTLKTKP